MARGLQDDNPWIRAWTIQSAHEDGELTSDELARTAAMAREDDSQVVRLYIASAVGKLPLAERWDILAPLVQHGEDAGDHNLPLMYWYALEPLVPTDPQRALQLAVDGEIALLRSYVPRRIGADFTDAGLQAVIAAVADADDDAIRLELLGGLDEGLAGRRRVEMPVGWLTVRGSLYYSERDGLASAARKLAVTFGDPDALAELRRTAADSGAPTESRQQAVATLVGVKDAELVPTLFALLSEPELQRDALRALGAYDDEQTPAQVLAVYPSLDLVARRDALNTLASRVAYSQKLLDAVEAGDVATAEITADVVRQLRNLRDEQLEARIREVWGTVRDTAEDKAQLIADYHKLVDRHKKDADVELGRAVFARTCQQCHRLFGTGADIGPELTGSNRADRKYLLDNVVDPSALVAKDYVATLFITSDGRTLIGLVRNETDQAVTVATANETVVIPQNEIEERQASTLSMMPDDLLKPLNEHEVASLVAYLASPQQVPMQANDENVGTFFNGHDLSGWVGSGDVWRVENGEIIGHSPQGLDHNEFLYSELSVGDFRLRFQVKLTPDAGNSGVQFRSEPQPDGEVKGYQADIGAGWWGKLYEELGRGILWDEPAEQFVHKEDWNDYEIVAEGSRVRTYLNGQLCVDLDDPVGKRRGVIAVQVHAGPPTEVRFRNLELELNPQRTPAAETDGP
ncbi:MAG: family 16 glycoside hydrolase [Pirellulales bacterium]